MVASIVIKDAHVITMEAAESARLAQAVAIEKDRILASGTNQEMSPS
jgi:predicted amidohydrolase YtcJ